MSRFADINVGDKVILPDGLLSPGRVAIVEKTTKTQFAAGGDRWLKNDGSKVGTARDAWHSCYVRFATPELIETCENYLTLVRLSQVCKLHLSPIQEHIAAAARARSRDDQLSLIDCLNKTAAILKTIPPFATK
jgi:hypothetical protein